jgi:hypothetical protein
VFEEFVPLVSTVLSVTSLLYSAQRTRSQGKKAQLEKLNGDLRHFIGDVLSWHNRVVQVTLPIIQDMKKGHLTKSEARTYREGLAILRRDDEYQSSCRNFVETGIATYRERKELSKELRGKLVSLKPIYEQFENDALCSRECALDYLARGKTKEELIAFGTDLEEELHQMEALKASLIQITNQML